MKERLHKKEKEHINAKLIDCKAAGFVFCVVADVALVQVNDIFVAMNLAL
ncbi:MAG: hypothetical protein M3227_06905 [Thermoproteota archaeon]|nr:hypothetical protein [Thermoproteota archaeon]